MNIALKEQITESSRRGDKRSMAEVLVSLDVIAVNSPNLLTNRTPSSRLSHGILPPPRYTFIGATGGGEPIRVGLFAGIHGDEPEGVLALVMFLGLLEAKPEVATGYCLFVYPVCNPTGFEANTRHASSGKDLNREFWSGSTEPEVQFLEAELSTHAFQGIISLHTDDTSDGFYGYAHGATLTEHLIEPALQAAEQFLPRNRGGVIDGFYASNGVIRDSFGGILSAPPLVRPRPFEIILETPQSSPAGLKQAAFVAALESILANYRVLIAYASNI